MSRIPFQSGASARALDRSERTFVEELQHHILKYQEPAAPKPELPLVTPEEILSALQKYPHHDPKIAETHVRVAEFVLGCHGDDLQQFVTDDMPLGALKDLALELRSGSLRSAGAIRRGAWREPEFRETIEGKAEPLEISMPILLHQGGRKGNVLTLTVEVVGDGTGEIYFATPYLFIKRDAEWRKAEADARAALKHLGIWLGTSNYDLRCSLSGKSLPKSLVGGSAGALFALAGARFFSPEWIGVDVSDITITATIDPVGQLSRVEAEQEKFEAAMQAPYSPEGRIISFVLLYHGETPEDSLDRVSKWEFNDKIPSVTVRERMANANGTLCTILGVSHFLDIAKAVREQHAQRYWRIFSIPGKSRSLFDHYRLYFAPVLNLPEREDLSRVFWINMDHGEALLKDLERRFRDHDSKLVVKLLRIIGQQLSQSQTEPQVHELPALESSTERIVALLILFALKSSPRHYVGDAHFQTREGEYHLKLEEFSIPAGEKIDHGLLLPDFTLALLEKGNKLQSQLTELQEDLDEHLCYIWTLTPDQGTPKPENWSPLDTSDVAEKLVEALKEMLAKIRHGKPLRPGESKRHLGRLLQHLSKFVWKVPEPVASFHERERDLHDLREALKKPDTSMIGVHAGIWAHGGVGKTQLIRAFAHRLLQEWACSGHCQFPGGVIEVNLGAHNYSASVQSRGKLNMLPARQPKSVREEILIKLGIEESTLEQERHLQRRRQSEKEIPGADLLESYYHREIDSRKVLLLLDNASDFEQIRTLIPQKGSGSRAIVTTRKKLSCGKEVRHCELGQWEEADIREYLQKRKNLPEEGNDDQVNRAISEIADHIFRFSDGLPLVVQIVSSFAQSVDGDGRQDTFVLALERLAQHQDSGDPVADTLDFCLACYPDHEAQLFERLAIFPASFTAAAAAGVWKISLHAAQRILERFVIRGLITPEHAVQVEVHDQLFVITSYRLHDRIRQHANSRITRRPRCEETVEQDTLRYVIHYIGCQAFQNDLLLNESPLAGAILGARNFEVASRLFENDEVNYHRVDEIFRKGEIRDLKVSARLQSLWAGIGTRACDLLLALDKREERIAAGTRATVSLLASDETNPAGVPRFLLLLEEAIHLNSLGLVHRLQNNDAVALGHFRQAGVSAEALKAHPDFAALPSHALIVNRLLGCAAGNEGNMFQQKASDCGERNPQERETHLRKSRQLHLEAERYGLMCTAGENHGTTDFVALGQDWGNRAIVERDLWISGFEDSRSFDEAIRLFDARIELACRIKDIRGEGNGHGNKGTAMLARYQQLPPSEERRKLADHLIEAYEKAKNSHRLALNLRGQGASEGNLGRAYRILAESEEGQGEKYLALAEYHTKKSLELFSQVGDLRGERIAYANLFLAYQAMGDSEKAEAARQQIAACEEFLETDGYSLTQVAREEGNSGLIHLADRYGKLAAIPLRDFSAGGEAYSTEVLKAHELCEGLVLYHLRHFEEADLPESESENGNFP